MTLTRRKFVFGLSSVLACGTPQRLLAEAEAKDGVFGAGARPLGSRIRRLLERTLARDVFPRPVAVKYDPADLALPEPMRIGKRLKEYMTAQPVAVRADEELVGWLPFDNSVENDLFKRRGHRCFHEICLPEYYLKPKRNLALFEWQHSTGDFPMVLREGLVGIRSRIAASRQKWAGNRERLDYLKGLDLALDGIEARERNCAAACRRLAERETDAARKAKLLEMGDRLDRVPMHPAKTFADGVQSVFFCYDFLADAIGRLDQCLAPLYFADLKAGTLTRDRAEEMLQELFIFIDAHTSHKSRNYDKGGESHMTVGGLTPEGRDGWTEFSQLVVEAALACNLKRPQMSFRWHAGTSRETLRFMLDCERRDPNARIAFDGDVRRVAAFERHLGLSPEEARDYCMTGCNEPTFSGGMNGDGAQVNAVRCLERVFTVRRREALACAGWADFRKLFLEELNRDLAEAEHMLWSFNELRARDCNVLSALFMKGCVENAESPTRGGCTRVLPCFDLLGTPNLIDSLCIVRQFVFEERRCTMAELVAALDADWKGHEKLREEIRRDGWFYGSNDDFSNGMAQFYHQALADYAKGHRDFFGAPFLFGNLTGYNDNSTKFGRLTGATPDGRHAGEFLSFGGGPAGGHACDAATSVLLSAAQMDPENVMTGSSILNLSLPASTVSDDRDFEKLVILVETYFRKGGLHLQLNHVSRETLVDAQRHPEKYPDLRVRVSGFSGYFVRFKKTIQDEIISRTVARP